MKATNNLSGWVLLSKKILTWEWYDDINVRLLFIHLLLTVNFKPNRWHGVEILRGQRVIGYPSLSEETGLSIQNIRTALSKLKSTGELTVKTFSKYSILTIENYSQYQDINSQTNRQSTVNQQATNRQSTTTEQINNSTSKQENKISPSSFETFKLQKDEVIKELSEKFPARDVPKAWKLLIGYYETHDGSKITDWRKHFEIKVQEDKFNSFTISPRFKPTEKKQNPVKVIEEPKKEYSAKVLRNFERIRLDALKKKGFHRRELTKDERFEQIMGIKKEKDPKVTEPQFQEAS